MLGIRRFFNFIDLFALRQGQKLKKLPIDTAIKETFNALERGEEEVEVNGTKVPVRRSAKGHQLVTIAGSLPVLATVFKTEDSEHGHYVTLEIGLAAEEVTNNESGTQARSEILRITGRVVSAEGGDPSVYFFDFAKSNYAKGFLAALRIISKSKLGALGREEGLIIKNMLKKSVLDDLQTAAGEALE